MALKQLSYIESNRSGYLDTGYVPNINTEIDMYFSPLNNSDIAWSPYLGSSDADDTNMTFHMRQAAYTGGSVCGRFGNNSITSGFKLTTDGNTFYHIVYNKDGMWCDDVKKFSFSNTSMQTSQYSVYIGGVNYGNNFSRSGKARFKSMKIRDNGTLVRDYIAVEKDGVAGFYDQLSKSFIAPPRGTFVAGPVEGSLFDITTDVKTLNYTSGSGVVNIITDADWTLSVDSDWITLDKTQGSGNDTVSFTYDENPGTIRKAIFEVTDGEFVSTLKITQKPNITAGQAVYVGGECAESLYLGTELIMSAFLGNNLVYADGLPSTFSAKMSKTTYTRGGGARTIRVASPNDWTITAPDWITLSMTGGNAGRYKVIATASENETGEDRSGEITVLSGTDFITFTVIQDNILLPLADLLYNFNAVDYDGAKTITSQFADVQLFTNPLVLSANSSWSDDTHRCISIRNKQYCPYNYPGVSRSGTDPLTIIFKVKSTYSGTQNLVANRNTNYNYMVRVQASGGFLMHESISTSFASVTVTDKTIPQIVCVRADGEGTQLYNYTENRYSDIQPTVWGGASDAGAFFSGYYNMANENFMGDFYWIYAANRKLTDEEVEAVINYNENYEG